MIAKTAEELGFYQAEYFNIYLSGEKENVKATAQKYLNDTHKVTLTTQDDLKKATFKKNLIAYTTIGTMFILLLIIMLIGYINTQNLKITLNIQKFQNLRLFGLSIKKLKRNLFLNSLLIPIIAFIITVLGTVGYQKFCENSYNEYVELFVKQQLAVGNKNYEQGFAIYRLDNFENGSELYNITERMIYLQNHRLLSKEMWFVSPWLPLLTIFGITILAVIIATLISMKNLANRTNLEENNND